MRKENWKNKVQSLKKSKSLYLFNYPEIKHKYQSKSKHTIDIKRNRNCLNPTLLKIGKENIKYRVLNTCPFDAVIRAIATGYIDSKTYADYVNVSKNLY